MQFNYLNTHFTEYKIWVRNITLLYSPVYVYCPGKINNGAYFESQKYPLSLENINSFLKWHASKESVIQYVETDKLDSMAEKNNLRGMPTKVGFYSTKGYCHLLLLLALILNLPGSMCPIHCSWQWENN